LEGSLTALENADSKNDPERKKEVEGRKTVALTS
jgi:hypothetical protein